jgi:hypothetical protein
MGCADSGKTGVLFPPPLAGDEASKIGPGDRSTRRMVRRTGGGSGGDISAEVRGERTGAPPHLTLRSFD